MMIYSTCIYRNPKTFKLCEKSCKGDAGFCHYHTRNLKDIYEIYHTVFGNCCADSIDAHSIYKLYMYVCDSVHFEHSELDHDDIVRMFFIELLKNIPKHILKNTYEVYGIRKGNLYNFIYVLSDKTYRFHKICGQNNICGMQSKIRKMISSKLIVNTDRSKIINKEDPFTYDSIDDISAERMFTYSDKNNSTYAFDAIEFDYFIRKCKKDGIIPYNPYTRETIDAGVLNKLELFIKCNKLQKKTDEYRWQTDLQAFTDLSIEIEKQGFYNSPVWFIRMSHNHLLKTIKLFKDFSADILESNSYFTEYKRSAFVFSFCKEGIRMFSECKEDLYILCCNFMKALAMYSKDFYENLPEWLVNTNTSSRLSTIYSIFNESLMSGRYSIQSNSARSHQAMSNNNDNFLLYYYVEYMQ